MTVLTNMWYSVAWSRDVADKPLPLTIAGNKVVLFRKSDGSVSALQDRCPHRFAPLSMGHVEGDQIRCRYHGMGFDGVGQCVHSPFAPPPKAMRIPSFPVVEQDTLIWLWTGDPALADPAAIPRLPFFEMPNVRTVQNTTYLDAPYEMLMDNLIDLSHASFLHAESFGAFNLENMEVSFSRDGDDVHFENFIPNDYLPVNFEAAFDTDGQRVDMWLKEHWRPAGNLVLEMGWTYPGRPRDEGRRAYLVSLVMPESETRTRYLWGTARNYDAKNEELCDQTLAGVLDYAYYADDKPMIEACFDRMEGEPDLMALKPMLLPTDVAAVTCRRVNAELAERDGLRRLQAAE